jgi:hypothetical protein
VILCSMFLMLGIGILLGAVANFTPEANKQQAATVKKLTQNLDVLTSESDRDEQRLQGNEEAISELVPNYVGKILAGKRYALIQTGDYSSAVHDATDAITAAGGKVTSVSVLTSKLTQLDPGHINQIAKSLELSGDSAANGADLSQIIKPLVLACQVGTDNLGSAQSDLEILSSDGLINQSGDYSLPVSGVLVIAGESDDTPPSLQPSTSSTSEVDQALLGDFAAIAPKMTIVGCETYDAVKSSLPDFTAAGISSVDCIDLPLGALDLPYALRDNGSVSYGLKSTASARTPAEISLTSAAKSESIQPPVDGQPTTPR